MTSDRIARRRLPPTRQGGGRRPRGGAVSSLRNRLLGLALVGALGASAVTLLGVSELSRVSGAEAAADVFEGGVDGYHRTETAAAQLRVQVLLGDRRGVISAGEAYLAEFDDQSRLGFPADHAQPLADVARQARQAVGVAARARLPQDAPAVLSALDTVAQTERAAAQALDQDADRAEARAGDARVRAQRTLELVGATSTVLLLVLALAVSLGLVRSLRRIRDVAIAVSTGDLAARNRDERSSDEVGELADAIDTMADALQELLDTQRREVRQQEFATRLAGALEHADDRPSVLAVVSRAMEFTRHDGPVELLLADSSRAHLEVQAVSPTHGAAGCSVSSPSGCPAVRGGSVLVMDDASALDACPRLQERADRVGSAVCAPVTFMGRALGVLHAVSPATAPVDDDVVHRLRSLAGQVSGRLGTVDALAQAELQAGTDVLTGLHNRRTMEELLGRLAASGQPYGLLLADLDHFKRINDAFGHEAGDRALRVFAAAMPRAFRDVDLVGRWGGEEFLVALPGASVQVAAEAGERLRAVLAQALVEHACPRFTVSAGVSDSYSGVTVEEQVARADEALLAAKAGGRDRVVVAGAGVRVPAPSPATA